MPHVEGDNQEPAGTDPKTEQAGENTQDQSPKTFSQDEVNDIIAKRVNEINAKNEEKTAKAIEKAIADYERKQQMSDEEKAKDELAQAQANLAKEKRDLSIRENRAEAREILQEKSMPSVFVNYVVDEDLEKTKENIDKFEKTWNEALSKAVDQRLAGKTPVDPSTKTPPSSDGDKLSTRDLLFGKKG